MQPAQLLSKALSIDEDLIDESFSMESIPQWDSFAHMQLILLIESELSIRLSPKQMTEIIDYREVKKLCEYHSSTSK